MHRVLAVGHIVIGLVLLPMTWAGALFAPILMIGPVWGIVLGTRLWKRAPNVVRSLRRTHVVFLLIDALMIWYGVWMLRAAEASAARGGGLLGGLGAIPIGLGIVLAMFSLLSLAFSGKVRPLQ